MVPYKGLNVKYIEESTTGLNMKYIEEKVEKNRIKFFYFIKLFIF